MHKRKHHQNTIVDTQNISWFLHNNLQSLNSTVMIALTSEAGRRKFESISGLIIFHEVQPDSWSTQANGHFLSSTGEVKGDLGLALATFSNLCTAKLILLYYYPKSPILLLNTVESRLINKIKFTNTYFMCRIVE